MPRILQILTGEGFRASIVENDDSSVFFTADADIDADGANGQHGKRAAYMVRDTGSEALANGGMKMSGGRVVGAASWFKDIVILGPDGQPKEFADGIIASRTAYQLPGFDAKDPRAYVDSETVPYVVVPPIIVTGVRGVVKGCKAIATNIRTGKSVECLVADVGPRTKCGEVSIEAARRLGVPENPRKGGTNEPIIRYEIFPDVPANVDGVSYRLQRANGTWV